MNRRAGDGPVLDNETLLRRYTDRHGPQLPRHVKIETDEGSGTPFLTHAALHFNPECSVYRARVLDAEGVPRDSVREEDYARIAEVLAHEVRTCLVPVMRHGSEIRPTPFEVTPSPWPDGPDGPARDVVDLGRLAPAPVYLDRVIGTGRRASLRSSCVPTIRGEKLPGHRRPER